MKALNLNPLYCLFLFALLFIACKKGDGPSPAFNKISSDKYNESDIFNSSQSNINQTWKARSTERDGINGPISSEVDFEFLLIKPNGIFGIMKDDDLITSGEIIIIENTDDRLTIGLEPEGDPDLLNIEMLNYNNIRVEMDSTNELRLYYGSVRMLLTEEN